MFAIAAQAQFYPLPWCKIMIEELSPKAIEIVNQTRSMLESGGYNSFSYADISARVHISKASIHHHFPSKAELVRAVVASYRDEAKEGMAMLDRNIADPLERLKAYVGYWSTCINGGASSFCICAMLAVELLVIPSEIADEVRGHFKDLLSWLTTIFEKGKATGQFKLQDAPAAEASAFMATVHGAMLAARSSGDPKAFQSLVGLSIAKLTLAT